ncbi:glycosyltransferase [Clostridium sp.]|uniref:glycosyltransferase n=1 Tax=Clostridium sp. TaxID=1506 RepID=UPI00261AFA61|nr:glycosyltransferase [Clostridium sp.]
MHVMFIPSWYSNNRNPVHGSFFKEQAKALQKEGIKITVAYNEIWPLILIGKIKEKIGVNINIEEGLKTYRYKNFNFLPKNKRMFYIFNKRMDILYKEVTSKEGKVDIIHCQSSFWAGISANYISKKYNIPLIITEHSSIKKAYYLKESYKPYIIDSYKMADKLITVGNALKKELINLTNRDDILVIPNLIPIDNFSIKENNNKEFTFFSLAFLEGEKGMDTLIKAFSKGFKNTNSKLIIGGEGSQKDNLIKLTEKLGITNKVEFLGTLSREEVSYNMRNCDTFVLASRYETFGVVYIEALASGKPVIGTYNGGAEDIINKENGIIVNIDNIDELAKGMAKIKDNIKEYNPLKIREDCIKRYSEKEITNKIINVYKELI